MYLTHGRTIIMYANDTSILNIQDINELPKTTSDNTGLVEQYFETNNLSIHPTRTLHSLPDEAIQAGK
jgi:hypothetical protein